MEDRILPSIKSKLPIFDQSGSHFDSDLIDHINDAFSVLQQLGVGPSSGFSISDEETTWSEFTSDTVTQGLVRSYVYFRVWLDFDTPTSSSVIESINRKIDELTFRLTVRVDELREEE